MGRGADQRDRAAFDVRKQNVLLGLVEPVDLVDEKNGFGAADPATIFSGFEMDAETRHIFQHAARAFELPFGDERDDFGKAGLSAAGRAVENDAAKTVRLDGPTEQFAGPQKVLLADHILQRCGPHARRKGLALSGFRRPVLPE